MRTIEAIKARQILDSRGNPTVEACVKAEGGVMARASVPSGASTGIYEAHELRDGDMSIYQGKSVYQAVDNVREKIFPALKGMDVTNQERIDQVMCDLDQSDNKSDLGANAILAVSLACAKAGAKAVGLPLFRYLGGTDAKTLPVPMMNILNGGAHAKNNVDIQEFMIMPVGAPSFGEGLRWCSEIFHTLGKILSSSDHMTAVGDEGGYAPNLKQDEEAIELILKAVESAGYQPGQDIRLAIDAAASEWKQEQGYMLPKKGVFYEREALVDYWENLTRQYPIISLEDPLDEDDFDGWQQITNRIGNRVQLVGDDVFVTNSSRLQKGISQSCANSILIKVNQIGTLSETLDCIRLAKKSGYTAVVSHRSGETEDTTIADIAVATNSGQIKTGAPSRTDRVAKYNRLLRIEDMLGRSACYEGLNAFGISSKNN